MKVLILILSFNESPYKELMQAQQQSFDSVEVEGVRTVYYYGGLSYPQCLEKKLASKDSCELMVGETDDYFFMSAKLKATLEYTKDWDYDVIFRSNSSSYICKQRLKEFAATLPTEKLYAGWTFRDSNSEDKGMTVSGAGIWLSKDCAEILREEIDKNTEMEEDVYISRILRKNGIVAIDDKSRYDVPITIPAYMPLDRYHYRLKSGPINRLADIGNMKQLHKLITA